MERDTKSVAPCVVSSRVMEEVVEEVKEEVSFIVCIVCRSVDEYDAGVFCNYYYYFLSIFLRMMSWILSQQQRSFHKSPNLTG